MEIKQENSLSKSASWLLFAKTIGFVMSFLLPIIVVRTLSKADMGIYNQVFTIIVTVSGILPLGVSLSAFYFLSRETERKKFYIFNILLFNFIVGGLAFLFFNVYPEILEKITQDAEMTHFAPQIGLVIWLWVFSTFFEIVAIANQEARLATAFIILAQLTKAVFMLTAVYIWGTVGAMLMAATFQAVLETIALFVYLNSRFPGFWKAYDRDLLVSQLKYALPFGFMGVLWILQTEAHNYFIFSRFQPEEVAIYKAGCFQLPLLIILYESISSVMIPRMSELESTGNKREIVKLTVRAMEKISLVYFPTYVFFFITAYTLITTLFTVNYAESVPVFLINITLLPFYVLITDPIVRAFSSLGSFLLKIRIVIVTLLLLVLYYGIQHFDLRGMIAIVVITALVDRFISLGKIWKTIGVTRADLPLLKTVAKTGTASILAGVPTFFVYTELRNYLPEITRIVGSFPFFELKNSVVEMLSGLSVLGLSGLVFAPVYLLNIHFFGILSDEERNFVFSRFASLKKRLGYQNGH